MSDDPTVPEPTSPAAGIELEVDLAAFLPDGAAIEADTEPERSEPPVDLAVLAGIEADLAAVDGALEAIDAGDPGRSPLLTELLGGASA